MFYKYIHISLSTYIFSEIWATCRPPSPLSRVGSARRHCGRDVGKRCQSWIPPKPRLALKSLSRA